MRIALVELVVPVVATVAAALAVAYSVRFIHDVFFNGEPVGLTRTPHEPPRWLRVPVEILVVVCLAVGIVPNWTVGPVLAAMVQGTLGVRPEYSLALWHGFNAAAADEHASRWLRASSSISACSGTSTCTR